MYEKCTLYIYVFSNDGQTIKQRKMAYITPPLSLGNTGKGTHSPDFLPIIEIVLNTTGNAEHFTQER